MRITVLVLVVAMAAAAAVQAAESEKRITIDVRDADLRFVVASIFDQAGLDYSFAGDVGGIVTAHIEDRPVDEALRAVLSPLGCVWRKIGGSYIISKKEAPMQDDRGAAISSSISIPPDPSGDKQDEKVKVDKVPLGYADAGDIVAFLQGGARPGDNARDYRTAGGWSNLSGQWNQWGTGRGYDAFSGFNGYRQGYQGYNGYGLYGSQWPQFPGGYSSPYGSYPPQGGGFAPPLSRR